MRHSRKNILLVCFDDAVSPWPYRSAFGVPLQTPNLDRICARATSFRAAYCQAPICGPSRASFMTGRAPHDLGVVDNTVDALDVVGPGDFWSYRLKNSGYFCSSGGKVHHRYKPVRKALHDTLYSDAPKNFGSDMKLPEGAARRKYGGHRGGWGTTDPADDGAFHDARSADSAVEFLKTYDGDAPFFREVGFFSPHGPWYTPARFKEMYDAAAFEAPAEWSAGFDANAFADAQFPENPKLDDLRWWQASVRNYFAAYSHGDHHLGRVWDALQASRHSENTVVIVLSDHGFHLGNRRRFMKTTLWEQVANVPLIIADPDSPDPREYTDPVGLIDLGPTVLDFAGLDPAHGTLGRSLRPRMAGAPDPGRAIPTFYRDNASVRLGDFRLVRYEDGTTQLFDLKRDPWNLRDLGAGHPAYASMYEGLRSTCRAYGLDIG